MNPLRTLLSVALLSAAASAQSFNLDVGPNLILAPTPPDTYGAAAGQLGHWDGVNPNDVPLFLTDVNDVLTGVEIDSDVHSWFSLWPLPALPPDDLCLLTDLQTISWLPGSKATWTFTGLQDGHYTLYTFAYDPALSGDTTLIRIPAIPGSEQVVGGVWGGSHQLGVTYAMHVVTVVGGALLVEAESMNGNAGTVNGFQLVSGTPFVPYCFGDPGAIPCPCGNSNDGSVPGSGCANGIFASGAQLSGGGVASLANDTVILMTTSTEPNESALYFQANNQISNPFWDGIQCAGGSLKRLGVRVSDGSGSSDTSGFLLPISQKAGNVNPGDTKYYQCWYRNPTSSPCATDANVSNGLAITWEP